MRKREFLLGASSAFTCSIAPARAKAATVLRLGMTSPMNSHIGIGSQAFARQTEQMTEGRVRVECYPSSQRGGELEMVQDINAGALEMCFTSTVVLAPFAPVYSVFDLPFVFRNTAHARAFLDAEAGQRMLSKIEDENRVALAWGENGVRHITTTNTPVRTPADLKGIKIRVPQSEIMVAAFKAFGADAQPLPFQEVYGALASGSFQAEENPIAIILPNALYEVQHHLSLTGHIYSPAVFLISRQIFAKISAQDQAAMRKAAVIGGKVSREIADQAEKTGVDELRKRGMAVVTDIDRAAFVTALAGVEADVVRRIGKDTMESIRGFSS